MSRHAMARRLPDGRWEAAPIADQPGADTEAGPAVWVCRDMPGEHAGGPGCWCVPHCLNGLDDGPVDLADKEKPN